MRSISNQIDYILTKEQLHDDYQKYGSIARIARKYSVSDVAIRSRLKKYNIDYKSKVHRYKCDHNFFSKENELSFYIAGFIAADGCVRISKTNKTKQYINHRLVIALSEKDLDFLNKIRSGIGCENPIDFYENKLSKRNKKWKDARIAKISITSKQMVTDLSAFNIVPNKTHTYVMPDWLLKHELLHHFVRGYIDGDGSFYILKDSSNINITFSLRGTLPFLDQIKNIFEEKVGIITLAQPRLSNNIGQFSIHSNKIIKDLVSWLYLDSTIYMSRKYEIAKKARIIVDIQNQAKIDIMKVLERDSK